MCWGDKGGVWCAGVKNEGVMCWSEEGGVLYTGVKKDRCDILR